MNRSSYTISSPGFCILFTTVGVGADPNDIAGILAL